MPNLLSCSPTTPKPHKESHETGGYDALTKLVRSIVTDFFATPFWDSIPDKPSTFSPSLHKASHQDLGSDEISVEGLSGLLVDAQKVTVRKNTGDNVGTRKRVNLIEGGNVTLTVLDDPADDEVDVTIQSAGGAVDPGEGHITILPFHYSGVTQGTWFLQAYASQWAYYGFYNSSDQNNDQVDYKVFLAAGTYTFSILLVKASTCAILDLLIDDVSKGTIDCYSGVTIYNSLNSIAGLVIPTSGIKKISIKISGRNPSCTEWYLIISSFCLFRTA